MNFNQTLTAGVSVEFVGRGDFFRIMDATDRTITVRFYQNGAQISEAENVGEGYAERFHNGQYFDKVVLTSSTTQTVYCVSRQGRDVRYDKAPIGDVAITNTPGVYPLDQGAVRSKAENTFGFILAFGAAAGTYATGQLWNVTGSGKRIVVQSVRAMTSTANAGLYLLHSTVRLNTTNNTNVQRKVAGSAVIPQTIMTNHIQDAASVGGSIIAFHVNVDAHQFVELIDGDPVIIPEGAGLNAATSIAGATFYAQFNGYIENV